jgi:hypothetical protein
MWPPPRPFDPEGIEARRRLAEPAPAFVSGLPIYQHGNGSQAMSIETSVIKRLAALNLSTEAFQEVLAIISEVASADEARLERQRISQG